MEDLTADADLLDVAHEVTRFGKTRLGLYMDARKSGSTHGFAAMVALVSGASVPIYTPSCTASNNRANAAARRSTRGL